MQARFFNEFHRTEAVANVTDGWLKSYQIIRIRGLLCPASACACAEDALSQNGPTEWAVRGYGVDASGREIIRVERA